MANRERATGGARRGNWTPPTVSSRQSADRRAHSRPVQAYEPRYGPPLRTGDQTRPCRRPCSCSKS